MFPEIFNANTFGNVVIVAANAPILKKDLTIYVSVADKVLCLSNRGIPDTRFATVHALADGADRNLPGDMHNANHLR